MEKCSLAYLHHTEKYIKRKREDKKMTPEQKEIKRAKDRKYQNRKSAEKKSYLIEQTELKSSKLRDAERGHAHSPYGSKQFEDLKKLNGFE